MNNLPKIVAQLCPAKVSAAADRPARRRGSEHAIYSVTHHMVIKPFLVLGLAAQYRSGLLSDDHQTFMTLTGELR